MLKNSEKMHVKKLWPVPAPRIGWTSRPGWPDQSAAGPVWTRRNKLRTTHGISRPRPRPPPPGNGFDSCCYLQLSSFYNIFLRIQNYKSPWLPTVRKYDRCAQLSRIILFRRPSCTFKHLYLILQMVRVVVGGLPLQPPVEELPVQLLTPPLHLVLSLLHITVQRNNVSIIRRIRIHLILPKLFPSKKI